MTSIVGTAFAIGALWLTDDRFVPGRGAGALARE